MGKEGEAEFLECLELKKYIMEDKNYNFVKLDSKLAGKIYDDVFSTSFKKAWNALWNVIGLVTSITIPIAMMNNYTNFVLEKNVKKFEKKLESVNEKDRIKVEPEIGVPILDKLTYYNNEKLSDLFLELLKKASSKSEVSKVHPKYVNIIENLNEDEALILKYIYDNKLYVIPSLNIHKKTLSNSSYIIISENVSELNIINGLKYKNQINTSIYNLASLWILNIWKMESLADKKLYDKLKNDKWIENIVNQFKDNKIEKIDLIEKKIDITPFWQWFLKAIF